jgi:alcohol dehydrogenase class IV/protocatechuate 3,4-dioxygenase beta subunit
MSSFVFTTNPARVVFGRGTLADLAAEVERLSGRRVLVVSGRSVPDTVDRAATVLGATLAARFDGAAMHTPVEVTERALTTLRGADADCLVSIGGGSATGLGKALALRTGLPLLAIPTTYAGSEVTPVLGETAGGEKTTLTATEVLPRVVLYDVDLTLDMPAQLAVTSGVNAMAHGVEALYSPQANPATDAIAVEAIRNMSAALRRIVTDPSDVDARSRALIGAWLGGTCLATVGMGLHHKLCHILGGTFDLPHAPTHTVVLPHAMAYNAPAAADAMRRIASALGAADAPAGMYDLITSLGGPVSLAALGFPADAVPLAAGLVTAVPYPNPREVTEAGVEALLNDALWGRRPASDALPDLRWLTAEVVASFDGAADRARQLLTSLVRHLHAFAYDNELTQEEWSRAVDFLTRTGQISSATRQEFILLSDVLGVSSMVDLLANSRTPQTTPSAVLGPFYLDSPPTADQGEDISDGQPGTPLWTDVRVTDTEGAPVAGATVDVWQSNEDGFYDVQLPDDGPALRARFTTDTDGRVRFWSILPSEYPIPRDGPVGELLAATGRHPYRAPHLHFLVDAPGYRRLTTQLFVAGGAYLDSDTVFGVKPALVVDFEPGSGEPPAGRAVAGTWRQLSYTFRIAREP